MMIDLRRCSVVLACSMLVACAAPASPSTAVRQFRADLEPAGAAQARGVSAAAVYSDYLIVAGTYSGLGSDATRAAILDDRGDEVFSLLVERNRSGRFRDVFVISTSQARDIRDGRYGVRVYSMLHSTGAGELQGTFERMRVRPTSEDEDALWESLWE